jgi:deazaflavin-dependent oxidoreductase (nitroreductase family)
MAAADNNNQQQLFLYLDTMGWKTGKRHQIEIWFVKYDDKYYVMSGHGERSHWVQNIAHDPNVSFRVSDKRFEGTARIVKQRDEPRLAKEVAKLMNAKYRWDDGLIVELKPAT